MAQTGDSAKPLFSYTAYSAFVGLMIGAGLLILASAWAAFLNGLSTSSGQRDIVLTVLFDAVLIIISVVSLRRRVWRMRFYENSFTARGSNLRMELTYPKIVKLYHYKIFAALRAREIIIIDTEGERSFAISGNPTNAALGTDLYHWLVQKAPPHTSVEEGTQGAPK